MEGELVAEYASSASPSTPQKEYGYRNGELLITAEAAPQVNLAVGKAATQISTIEGAVAGRAVDGNTSGQWTNGSVTHTGYQYQGWWEVDLGSVQSINTVKLWNRTDCCQSRLSNFYVLVSNSAFTSTDLTTVLNQSGVSSYYTASMAGASLNLNINRTGRYVRVQLAGSDYLSLAEAQMPSKYLSCARTKQAGYW